MASERITLATIAERLGVSRSTVSNAYNRPDQLSDELRQRVLDTAAELGYAGPDPAASALRRGKVGAIGLVQKSMSAAFTDPASQLLMAGVAAACDRAALALVVVPRAAPDDGPDVLRSALVDGLIVYCDTLNDERSKVVVDRQLPVVTLDGQAIDGAPWVGIDDEGAAHEAAQHLVDLGHRRLLIVEFAPIEGVGSSVTEARRRGYLTAINDAGIADDAVLRVAASTFDHDSATASIREALASATPPPTAVLAMSDQLAFAAIDAAHDLGRSVPDDLAVVGFDDVPAAESAGLTTVRQPHADKGRTAVTALLDDDAQTSAKGLVLPTELVVRTTTAPAR